MNRLNSFVKKGGHIVYGFKSGFCNENVQVHSVRMPGLLKEASGFSYQQFMNIDKLKLTGDPLKQETLKIMYTIGQNYWSLEPPKFWRIMIIHIGVNRGPLHKTIMVRAWVPILEHSFKSNTSKADG